VRWPAGDPPWAGLEGAARSTTTGDVSTAGVNGVNDEERNESIESRARGLPEASLFLW
jgi:hypothetical protein